MKVESLPLRWKIFSQTALGQSWPFSQVGSDVGMLWGEGLRQVLASPTYKLYNYISSNGAQKQKNPGWKDLSVRENPSVPKKRRVHLFLVVGCFNCYFHPFFGGRFTILPFFLGDGLKPPPIWFCSSCLLVLGVRFMETTRNLLSK